MSTMARAQFRKRYKPIFLARLILANQVLAHAFEDA
jgi:hypothetical protein